MGLEDRALAEFEIAIAVDENCVEAHREYQNLMRARCQERELLRAYRERLANDPQNPAWHYLLGRMLPDPDEQRDAFARAVRLDPKFFWGHYGLGYQAEVRGEIEAARGHYGRAVALDPARPIARLRLGDLERRARQPARAEAQYQTVIGLQPEEPDGYLGLALLLEEKRRGHDALHVCREAIQRRPADLAAQAVYRSLLAQYGAHSDFRDALDLLEGAVREAPVTASLELTRAVCAQGLGEVLPAIDGYSRAIRLGASPIGIAGALRLLHVRQGDYGAALRDFEVVAPPALLFDPENVIRFIFEELYAATSAAAERPSDAAPLLRLAEAYAACGWVAEAISQFHRVLYVDPGNPRARVGLERAVRHERFVRRLRERILEGYRRAAAGQESDGFAASLRGALAEIDLMGREILERNVAAPRRLREYAFIGAQLDPSIDSDDALMAYLREWNQILLLGRRAGSPTEALLLHRIAVFPKRPRRTASGTIEFDEVIGGQSAIPSLREHQGARLGGVTFEGMFVIHFDTVLAWQERARRAFQSFHLDAESLLSAPAAPAPTRALQQRVGHTFCLEEKLYLRAYHDYLENQRGRLAPPPLRSRIARARTSSRCRAVSSDLGASAARARPPDRAGVLRREDRSVLRGERRAERARRERFPVAGARRDRQLPSVRGRRAASLRRVCTPAPGDPRADLAEPLRLPVDRSRAEHPAAAPPALCGGAPPRRAASRAGARPRDVMRLRQKASNAPVQHSTSRPPCGVGRTVTTSNRTSRGDASGARRATYSRAASTIRRRFSTCTASAGVP
jgi:tetratricopeptide (TPR) repeat protein